MSFSKAEVKRFNDIAGCAPPVGAYDPQNSTKAAGGVIEKSERFKHPKDVGDSLQMDSMLSLSNPRLSSTPKKSHPSSNNSSSSTESLVHSMCKKSSAKKPVQVGEHLSRIKELEMEIRRLLREKSDKDKELQRLRQEQERLEGRLNSANTERSSCLARSAQLEQEVRDAKRGLEILQKQVASTETSGRKKEDKLRDEVQTLQGKIHSKEREIQSTQKQIFEALLAVVTDAEQCAKYSDGLTQLLSKLELNTDVAESEDEEKVGTSNSELGLKHIDSQIKRVRRYVRRVSGYISKLAESGVDRLEGIQKRLEGEHSHRLQEVSLQLDDTRLQHQRLQNQLSQQQQDHEHHLAAALQQRQEERESMQQQMGHFQQDCEQAKQRLEQTLEEYSAIQLRLQQSQEEQLSVERTMQQDRDALESRLAKELEALECRLKEEQEAVEQRLKEEYAALECRLQESRELRNKEVGDLQESCQQTQEKLDTVCEQLRQKEAKLAELENNLCLKQAEHESVSQDLQEDLEQLQGKLKLAKEDLMQKEVQHQEALLQLQQLQESERKLKDELQDSQECHSRMQQQVDNLQQGELQLKDLVDNFKKSRDNLHVEKEAARKELELKGELLAEALQTLKGEAYMTSETGTPTKTRQVLFEEMAEKAAVWERMQEIEEENKILNSSIQSLTAKYQNSIQELEEMLVEERKKSNQMSARFSVSEEEREKLTEELNQTQLVNRDLMESLSVFKDEVCSLKAGSSNLKKQLEEEKVTNQDLQTTIQDLTGTLNDLTEELGHEKTSHTDLEAGIRELTEQLGEQRTSNTELGATITHLTQQLEGEKRTNIDLEAAIKNLQLRVEEEQQTADTACREARMRVEQLEVENKQHQIANKALKGQLNMLTDEHSKETAELKDKCQSLQQEKCHQGEKHKEDLQSVRKALALDRQANDLQMEELNCKLERAQAFNTQLKEEMKRLLRDNEKLKDDSHAEVAVLQVKVETAEAQVTEVRSQSELLHHQAKHAQAEWLRLKSTVDELEACLANKEDEMACVLATLKDCHTRLAAQQDTVSELQAEKEALEEHLNRLSGEYSVLETDKEKQISALQAAALEERADYERMMNEMSEKIEQLEEEQAPTDADEWKQKYEELFARVEPFMEQLDAFAAERNLLVGRNEMAEAEMAKMMDKYARLLGHQNQKQKIQYVNKMKDDYMQCRKEKEALKEKANKMQATIQRLEKRIQSFEGRKTLDPSQAFKHPSKKEDLPKAPGKQEEPVQALKAGVRQDETVRSPLKQSNKR